MEKIIKSCRGLKQCNDGVNRLEKEKQRETFRTILGFKEYDIMNVTEKIAPDSIKNAFEGENIQTHYRVLGYEIDIYFHHYKLAVEIDEKDHLDRDISREIERQKALEKEISCKLNRINPDKENFNVFKAQNEIFRHINESNKESTKEVTKKSLIDKLSNKLLKLELKKNNSIKTKCLKHVIKKIFPILSNKYADLLFKVQEKYKEYRCKIMKTKNRRFVLSSKCAICGSKKSKFMKEQEAEGLLSNLGVKTPLSKIQLLNVLF